MLKITQRYGELDLLRALAIVLMVLYHLVFDLSALYGWDIDVFRDGWWLLARTSANLFLLLVGISFSISWERSGSWRKYMRRGLFIFSCGLLVSIATYVFDPASYVRFGILHLIGVSMILLPLFASLKRWNVLLGIGLIIAGNTFIKGMTAPTSLFIPLGIPPTSFETVDYFPLLPWFGVILIGVGIGNILYIQHNFWRTMIPSDLERWSGMRFASVLSRYSLLIYLLHQPLLLLLLRLMIGSPTMG